MVISVPPALIGTVSAEIAHEVDERRLLAFAAGIPDTSPPVFDADRPDGIVAHPLFHVAIEWPLAAAGIPGLPMAPELRRLGLHVSHDATHHRPIRPGDRLRTTAAVSRAEPRSVGVYLETRYETTGADGEPVVTNLLGMLYRGVSLDGGTQRAPGTHVRDAPLAGSDSGSFAVGLADAFVYTECSGIWNPVHTDGRVARAAGLPAPILHGTCCLARTVSILTARFAGGDPSRVARVRSSLAAIVVPETTIAVAARPEGGGVAFEARLPDGSLALRDGLLEIRPPG